MDRLGRMASVWLAVHMPVTRKGFVDGYFSFHVEFFFTEDGCYHCGFKFFQRQAGVSVSRLVPITAVHNTITILMAERYVMYLPVSLRTCKPADKHSCSTFFCPFAFVTFGSMFCSMSTGLLQTSARALHAAYSYEI